MPLPAEPASLSSPIFPVAVSHYRRMTDRSLAAVGLNVTYTEIGYSDALPLCRELARRLKERTNFITDVCRRHCHGCYGMDCPSCDEAKEKEAE